MDLKTCNYIYNIVLSTLVLYCIVLYDEGQSKPISNGASERHSSEGFRKPHTTLSA